MHEATVTLFRPSDYSSQPNGQRMPPWIRQNLGQHQHYGVTAAAVHNNHLNTVCEEARCPNRGECWSNGTATIMLLGDTCTRACGFCAVKTGRPDNLDQDEPRRVAEAILQMKLNYVVLTSVNRDDLSDGGAGIFADTLRNLRQQQPELGLEILTPDFQGCQQQAVDSITQSVQGSPNASPRLVWGHNIETVPSLYKTARKGSKYERSLRLLELAAGQQNIEAKSAIMLGLGERREEVISTLRDLRDAGVTRIALGQYLRPSREHLPVKEYLHPNTFGHYATEAREMGYTWVKAGPLVRSSYHAEEQQK